MKRAQIAQGFVEEKGMTEREKCGEAEELRLGKCLAATGRSPDKPSGAAGGELDGEETCLR